MKAGWKRMLRLVVVSVVAIGAVGAGLAVAEAKINNDVNRIVGGEPAAGDEFPFLALLSIDSGQGGAAQCGGSLIAPDVILTAAHCIGGLGIENGAFEGVTATLGTTTRDDPNAETLTSTEVFTNEGFDDQTLSGDWALIKLAEESQQTPVTLVNQGEAVEEGDFTVAGFGTTSEGGEVSDELLKVTVPFVDDQTCEQTYADTFDADAMLCAGAEEGKDSCQGDSGGPLMTVGEDGAVTQAGVVSFGEGCARDGVPGVYTELSTFADDVAAAVENLGGAAEDPAEGDDAGAGEGADEGEAGEDAGAGEDADAGDDAGADEGAGAGEDEAGEDADVVIQEEEIDSLF